MVERWSWRASLWCLGGLWAAVFCGFAEEAAPPELPSRLRRPVERVQAATRQLHELENSYYESYQRSVVSRYARALQERDQQIAELKQSIERLALPQARQLARLEADYERLNSRLEHASKTREEQILDGLEKLSTEMAACREAVSQLRAPLMKIEEEKKAEVRPEFDEALGRPVPRLRLSTLEDESVSLDDYCGKKAVLLYIWSRANEGSRLQLPRIVSLAGQLDRERTALVTIALEERTPESPLLDYLKEYKHEALVLVDNRDRTAKELDVTQLPVVYLIDAGGKVRWKVSGRLAAGELTEVRGRMAWVLGEKPAAAAGAAAKDKQGDEQTD
jgi:peroxiredoxin